MDGPIERILHPLRAFVHHPLAGAGLLLGAAVVAIVWANSPFAETYHHLLHLEAGVELAGATLSKTVHHWINDGLMGIFFFVVGLEIKRELMAGELSSVRKATLPAVAAVGGMLVPALVYVAMNPSGAESTGWGIPMATDIAFALGVLAVLGDRVPLGLKVFLTALAIVDDIGAVLVIAIFYTDQVSILALGLGLGLFSLAILANVLRIRAATLYFILGTGVWLAFLESGVHATVAAILMAFTIPARSRLDGEAFVASIGQHLEALKAVGLPRGGTVNTGLQQDVLERMDHSVEEASAPLQELQRALDPLVVFVVLPVFALANAGVSIGGDLQASVTAPVSLGVIAGLFFGKQIGVAFFAWLAVKLKIADLPRGVGWGALYGVAALSGIGFTMSLFIGSLAFDDPAHLEQAKVGILTASLFSALVGLGIVRLSTTRAAPRADQST